MSDQEDGGYDILERGRQVLKSEIEGLEHLLAGLDHNFTAAVTLLNATKGRIVVTGMGKSGHIGKKIAATLAATGAPAMFVHPGEAAHGDLGMVQQGDTLIVFSNSGNTSELGPIVTRCVNLEVPIVGVASRDDSFVIRKATVKLLLPRLPEACSANIAPTTSTTMTLALGDALAMALMDLRGIGKDFLKNLHPGGTIGQLEH